jgi:membrane protein YdbS with pleckstrin-like domain
MGFPQRLLADDERLVLVLRRHIKVLLAPLLILLISAGIAGVLIGLARSRTDQTWLTWTIVGIAVLIVLRWSLWPFLTWWYTIHAITTRRLVLRTGVLNRSGHDMPLTRLNDVSFEHNLIERMLGCGTLVVESAGERGQLTLEDIPKVELVQRTLYRLSDDLRGISGRDRIDPGLADDLDAAFDDEYRGPPAAGGRSAPGRPGSSPPPGPSAPTRPAGPSGPSGPPGPLGSTGRLGDTRPITGPDERGR